MMLGNGYNKCNLRCVFNDLMRKHHRQGVLLGQTTASTPEEYFGFHHKQVKAIHFHKHGVGEGLWFRLRCGRVVDEVATASARDPDLYDQAAIMVKRWMLSSVLM